MERLERTQTKILGTPSEKNLCKIRNIYNAHGVLFSQTELIVSEDTQLCAGVGRKPGLCTDTPEQYLYLQLLSILKAISLRELLAFQYQDNSCGVS